MQLSMQECVVHSLNRLQGRHEMQHELFITPTFAGIAAFPAAIQLINPLFTFLPFPPQRESFWSESRGGVLSPLFRTGRHKHT